MPCDGCGRPSRSASPASDEDLEDYDEPLDLETCEDCGWRVCEECTVDERRGVCRCLNSDMGNAYCDMDGPKWYMGSGARGERYMGPFKCAAQRETEAALLMDRASGGARLTVCCNHECAAPLAPDQTKLCTRCRSVVYCSVECQRRAWTTPHGVHGAHKDVCGAYLPPERWPYVSRDFRAYHDFWGHYPTAKPTAAQRAASAHLEAADGHLEAQPEAQEQRQEQRRLERQEQPPRQQHEQADDEARRRAYLQERDAMLRESGLGEFAGGWHGAAPDSPGAPQSPGAPESPEAAHGAMPSHIAQAFERARAAAEAPMEVVDDAVPEMMSHAQASARAREILAGMRRDFGRA